jgi:hypothetical protein
MPMLKLASFHNLEEVEVCRIPFTYNEFSDEFFTKLGGGGGGGGSEFEIFARRPTTLTEEFVVFLSSVI